MVDYFLLQDFRCMVLEHDEKEWKEIVPRDNGAPHVLLLTLFDQFAATKYDNIVTQTPFHKLSYKFSEEQMCIPGSFYKKILEEISQNSE